MALSAWSSLVEFVCGVQCQPQASWDFVHGDCQVVQQAKGASIEWTPQDPFEGLVALLGGVSYWFTHYVAAITYSVSLGTPPTGRGKPVINHKEI